MPVEALVIVIEPALLRVRLLPLPIRLVPVRPKFAKLRFSVPSLTRTPPEKVFAEEPLRASVPVPDFVNPEVPAITLEIVLVPVVTLTVGEAPAMVRVPDPEMV